MSVLVVVLLVVIVVLAVAVAVRGRPPAIDPYAWEVGPRGEQSPAEGVPGWHGEPPAGYERTAAPMGW